MRLRYALAPEARVALADGSHWCVMAEVYGSPMTHCTTGSKTGSTKSGAGSGSVTQGL